MYFKRLKPQLIKFLEEPTKKNAMEVKFLRLLTFISILLNSILGFSIVGCWDEYKIGISPTKELAMLLFFYAFLMVIVQCELKWVAKNLLMLISGNRDQRKLKTMLLIFVGVLIPIKLMLLYKLILITTTFMLIFL